MNNKTQFTVIIPTYNEADAIRNTLLSLIHQIDDEGKELNKDLYQIIIVNNNSTDNTVAVVEQTKNEFPKPIIHIVTETSQGIVSARITGYNYAVFNKDITTPYLASGDSDIYFHPKWVFTILKYFKNTGVDVISNAGCFPDELWCNVPNLVERYLDEVGTIFFNPDTLSWTKNRRSEFLFTEQIFFDFIRPVTDGCFAITKSAYLSCGGYTLEFWDSQKQHPVHGEGWRLVFKLERMGANIIYVNEAPYNSNPRRLLEEPEKFLGTSSYSTENIMTNLRKTSTNAYTILNDYSKHVDLKPVQKYIVDYYIILKCITRPQLIHIHPEYFGRIKDDLLEKILSFWKNKSSFEGKELFALSNELGTEYMDEIMKSMSRRGLA